MRGIDRDDGENTVDHGEPFDDRATRDQRNNFESSGRSQRLRDPAVSTAFSRIKSHTPQSLGFLFAGRWRFVLGGLAALVCVALSIFAVSAITTGGNPSDEVAAGAECSASGPTLDEARRAYSSACELPRHDCDPVGSEWVCSSEQLGDDAPSPSIVDVTGSSTSPTTEEPGSTTSEPATTTEAPGSTTTRVSTPSTTAVGQPPGEAQTISSIAELIEAFGGDGGHYRLEPGEYVLDSLLADEVTVLRIAGSNNFFDLTDVTIDLPVKLLSTMSGETHTFASIKIEGNNNTVLGGNFVNTYADGSTAVTDFKAYNEDRSNSPGGGSTFFQVAGNGNQLLNNTVTVRGSYPYGYGEMFGKGSQTKFGSRKQSGIQVIGDDTLIDGMDLTVEAFGHGIFMQGADNTVIRNTQVQGKMRLGSEMYEDGAGSLPDKAGFEQFQPDHLAGQPIDKTRMYPLVEDGIRAYTSGEKLDGSSVKTGSITVEDSTVVNMRGCVTLALADGKATVDNVEVRGCEAGFNLPNRGGSVTNSRGDAAFGPIIAIPYGSANDAEYDITVLEPEFTTGDHALATIGGSNFDITLRSDGTEPVTLRPIRIGFTWDRWDFEGKPEQHEAKQMVVNNLTSHPVELTNRSSDIALTSNGTVDDSGSRNSVN